MTYRKFDAGVVDRPKGASLGDCQVRALTTARGIPYKDAWRLLYQLQGQLQGELHDCGFTLVESLMAGDVRLGVKRKLNFQAVKGQSRMTGAEFVKKHPKGHFILRMSHHVVAVKDGVLFDVTNTSHKCVYVVWEIEPATVAASE